MQELSSKVARNLVAVVIPFHKAKLNDKERLSLRRCRKILPSYPRFLVVGASLDTRKLLQEDDALRIIRFPDHFFSSWTSYNLLCRQPEFYKQFLDYEYILIHQLDSYVFRDELQYWCKRNYDYIGAALPQYEHMRESRKWYSKLPFFKIILKRTAQGGFSLRRVATFYNASLRQAWLLKYIPDLAEDVYWSTIGCRLQRGFKLVGVKEAIAFSFDASPQLCSHMSGGQLPFGCHGWYGKYADFWKDKIEEIQPGYHEHGEYK